MPITFHFSDHIIWITLSGQYSLEDGLQTYSAILRDPAFNEGMDLLFDARESKVNPSLAQVKERVVFLRSVVHHSSGRMAIVVSDALRYGLSRMLSTYAQMRGMNIDVFRDVEEALCWLGSEPQHRSTED